MNIRIHFVEWLAFQMYYFQLKDNSVKLFCPKGWCLSLSGLSTESEIVNILSVLCASSEAGGENQE
jgi:hypothetical protein